MGSGVNRADLELECLVQSQKPGFSLEQAFYIDPVIYRHDLEKIFFTDWLYICHLSQIPDTGDCYTFDIGSESIIVSRDENLQVHAFANVCRHRGSRLCEAGQSNQKRFVCSYHAWTYSLSGELLKARLMPEGFDKPAYRLIKLSVEILCGLVFVSLSPDPPAFKRLKQDLARPLGVFDLANTRVAHQETHHIDANWKLVFENFNECYHCGPAHKEFSASHSLKLEPGRLAEFNKLIAERASRAGICSESVGLSQADKQAGTFAPYYYDRYALFEGFLTGSQDGQPVAPLLGQVSEYDGGASNIQIGNLTYMLVYADHVVLYRFIPRAVDSTDAELIWFVRAEANEQDYDLGRMTWLWNVTTEADKKIIERNQQGILSRYYRPGPYAPMEIHTTGFIKWYLERIAGA